MRITPLDIQQKNFPLKFRGFHNEEVSSFLELIREEIEDLLRENATLKEQIQKADEEIKRFWEMGELLSRSLLEAHQMAEEYKIHGRKEASLLLERAAVKAEEMVGEAHEQALAIHEEIIEFKMMRKRFHQDMRSMMERFRQIISDDGEVKNTLHTFPEAEEFQQGDQETVPSGEAGEALLPAE
jgi:cell division initiation protein